MSAAADVELVLDVRGMRKPPDDRDGFAALWAKVEPALRGRDLRAKAVHELDGGAEGIVRLEVARIADRAGAVTAGTRFSVVAVREKARLLHRCKECADQGVERYGPFPCSAAESDEHRACDTHVSILDGALVPTCGAHQPRCRECGRPATFRCAGPACRREVAWCDEHRLRHPQDRDLDYCSSCYAREFPRCEAQPCSAVGTVRCEHMDGAFQACGQRMCTKHAWRWQVFGGERLGLGRCAMHANVTRLPPRELIFQIIAGASARRHLERLPSLQGFAHAIRRANHDELALDYRGIMRMLTDAQTGLTNPATLGPERDDRRGWRSGAQEAAIRAMREMRPAWDRQLADTAGAAVEGERLMAKLRQVVQSEIPYHGQEIAAAVRLAEYRPAIIRNGQQVRQPLLFVHVPEHMRGRFIGTQGRNRQHYSEVLQVSVQIEGGSKRR